MATTTNFGWETPDDTDLVKDGAAAIRTALGGVDTSFVDLKGGTTGQVLAKASNTDLDYSWVAIDPLVILDAKGDLISATAADTPARLAVGANDQVLTADSTTATGLKWAAVPSGGMTLLASGTLSGTGVTLSSISQSYKNLIIYMRNVYNSGGTNDVLFQLNSGGTNRGIEQRNLTGVYQVQAITSSTIFQNITNTNTNAHACIFIPDYTASSAALAQVYSSHTNGANTYGYFTNNFYPTIIAPITSIQLNSPSTFGGGTYELWGCK